jgi:monoamine oxidase
MKNDFNRAPVVIILAGVAGLTAANLLARNGFNVTIFEAGNKIGGCCATTTLDGYTFNDGAVYLAVTDVLDHVFAKAGLDRVELLPLRKITANFSARAAAVISTASGMLTFSSLIEAEQAPAAVVRTLKRLRLSHKAVSIQFGLLNKIEAPAHSVNVLPWMEYQHEIFMQDGREMKFSVYLVPTVTRTGAPGRHRRVVLPCKVGPAT